MNFSVDLVPPSRFLDFKVSIGLPLNLVGVLELVEPPRIPSRGAVAALGRSFGDFSLFLIRALSSLFGARFRNHFDSFT